MLGLWIVLAHLWGDYLLQTNDMAQKKTTSWFWATSHALCYSIPYALLISWLDLSWWALPFITLTHVLIDRFRLTTWITWLVNGRGEKTPTGFPATTPIWLATGLMIVVDNTIHLTINAVAITLT